MGFVKTPDEVERICRVLRDVEFVGSEVVTVDFLTDADVVAHVLPPGLEPTDTPRMTAMVGRWRSNCVGDFAGGGLYVAARRGDVVADYVLALYMDTDASIIFGRELYGEPKRQATAGLYRQGSRAAGYVERRGVRLIELEVLLGDDLGPRTRRDRAFNVKSALAPGGDGLAGDAIITLTEFTADIRVARPGEGAVVLRGTPHDPLDEIPIRRVLGGRYVESDRRARCREAGRIPAADYLPYALARMDDWSLLATGAAGKGS